MMPSFLHFYQGAITRDQFWQLTRREYVALMTFQRDEMKRLEQLQHGR